MIKFDGKTGSCEIVGDAQTLAADFATGMQIAYEKLKLANEQAAKGFKDCILACVDKDSPIYIFRNSSPEEDIALDKTLTALLKIIQKLNDED